MFGIGKNTADKLDEAKELREARIAAGKLGTIERLPEGVTIRRIRPKKSDYCWAVRFKGGTDYYGVTLTEAIEELLDKNLTVWRRYVNNTPYGDTKKGEKEEANLGE